MSGMDDAIKNLLCDFVDEQNRRDDKESKKNRERRDETMRQLKERTNAEN